LDFDPHGCDHWIIDDGVEGYCPRVWTATASLCVLVLRLEHRRWDFKGGTRFP